MDIITSSISIYTIFNREINSFVYNAILKKIIDKINKKDNKRKSITPWTRIIWKIVNTQKLLIGKSTEEKIIKDKFNRVLFDIKLRNIPVFEEVIQLDIEEPIKFRKYSQDWTLVDNDSIVSRGSESSLFYIEEVS